MCSHCENRWHKPGEGRPAKSHSGFVPYQTLSCTEVLLNDCRCGEAGLFKSRLDPAPNRCTSLPSFPSRTLHLLKPYTVKEPTPPDRLSHLNIFGIGVLALGYTPGLETTVEKEILRAKDLELKET